ncbi:MAG: MFS transporter [Herbiconiux sp.]|uniref:MFS transporter n=1 Tax=Herbiconiux sp. TaxID=1871186 RepID=UPI0011FF54B3|nr:MFS transporter [Herbiconiux sp.]TAJ48492.1 MAG: MFS transporter [Herbiconiux sp.]
MSQSNPSSSTESSLPPHPSGPISMATTDPPASSWRQYAADFVKAPARAKVALVGSLLMVAISPSGFAALTPFAAPAYAMATGTPPQDAILLFVTLPLILGPLVLPFAGRWVDRYGAQRIALPAVILYALATLGIPLVAGTGWLVGLMLVLSSIFGFAASLGIVFKVISGWFPKHRGIGFGLIGVVSSLASAVFSPLFQWLVNGNAPAAPAGGAPAGAAPPAGAVAPPAADPGVFLGLGWDGVYYVLAIAIAVIGIPTVIWLISEPKIAPAPTLPKSVEAALPGVPFKRAVSTRAWIFIALLLTLAATGPIAIRQNAVDLFGGVGIDSATVSLGLSVLFTTSVVGLLLGGTILDRARHPWVVAILIATVPVGMALAILNTGSTALLFVSMALLGFATGAESALGPALIARYFGLKSFAALQGLTLAITGPALALSPYLVSAIQASSGSYTVPLVVVTGLTIVAVVLAVLLPKYPAPWPMHPREFDGQAIAPEAKAAS